MRCWAELALLLLLAGCATEEPEAPQAVTPTSLAERECPEGSILTYESFGGPFMSDWCTGCHGEDMPEGERQDAPLDMNFDEVEDVRRNAERIWARAADHNQTMPPLGGPHELERGYLGEWLACGAPTNDDME